MSKHLGLTDGELHDFGLEMGEFVNKWDGENNDGQWVTLGDWHHRPVRYVAHDPDFRDAWVGTLKSRMLHDFPYVDDLEFCQRVKCYDCDAYVRFVTEYGRQLLAIVMNREN